MQAEIDFLTNQVDLSEIVSEQGCIPGGTAIHPDLIIALQGLAKDTGYSFVSILKC